MWTLPNTQSKPDTKKTFGWSTTKIHVLVYFAYIIIIIYIQKRTKPSIEHIYRDSDKWQNTCGKKQKLNQMRKIING